MSVLSSIVRSGVMPKICRSNAAWCRAHRASPFGTTGSPRGCPSGKMCAASSSSSWRSRQTAQHSRYARSNLLSKRLLVKPALGDAGDIRAPSLGSCVVFDTRGHQRHVLLVDCDREDQVERVVSDDIDGPGRHVPPRHDAEQVDERRLALHRQAESLIVPMTWICPPVPILEKPALTDPVVVRARLSLDNGNRRNS